MTKQPVAGPAAPPHTGGCHAAPTIRVLCHSPHQWQGAGDAAVFPVCEADHEELSNKGSRLGEMKSAQTLCLWSSLQSEI